MNPVHKFGSKINKPKVHTDRKKAQKNGYKKHKDDKQEE